MSRPFRRSITLSSTTWLLPGFALLVLLTSRSDTAQKNAASSEYGVSVQPLIATYCLSCHSTKLHKGSLDLERFASSADLRKDLKVWQTVIEQLEAGEMPPKGKKQPTVQERQQLMAWVRGFLDDEARARAGDPGHVPMRRLSNAEYDRTIADLTGVDLRPARQFPTDGAAGEGFTNAAESLSDISPTLLAKYHDAAKEIAAHTVLLPDGFRFSQGKTRRDWTDEGTARLRHFYAKFIGPEGRLPVELYLKATLAHREELLVGKTTLADVAADEKLNEKYLRALWEALTEKTPSQPLDTIRAKWRAATRKDAAALAAEVTAWQAALWRTVRVGSYIRAAWGTATSATEYTDSLTRQVAVDPPALDSVQLRLACKPTQGQSDMTLYLAAQEQGAGGPILWQRPRLESAGKPPLLLRDYADETLVKGGEAAKAAYGMPKEKFTGADIPSFTNVVIAVKLPAGLIAGREFVVDAKLGGPTGNRLVFPRLTATLPESKTRWDGPLLGAASGNAYRQLVVGNEAFRRVFPMYVCFPQVVPTDEVVSLKMFHREDEPLVRLFLTDEQAHQLDRLWLEQRFISRQPVAEYDYLPQFMGFTTQDTPKEFQQFFIDRKPLFKKRADDFRKDEEAAEPRQLDLLLTFAGKAYRRPLTEGEKSDLSALYQTIRKRGAGHDEAFRGVLTRVLLSPSFLFRVEHPPEGEKTGLVNDWELASRLSYFLWSSLPDDELRALAEQGKLRDPNVLIAQARRMLQDDRARALAVEFGTQWLHIRGFDTFAEKNEKLFPTFDASLRAALYEEAILFFQDLFRSDRAVTQLLDADYTFLNETLARHYGIPNVTGPQWRRVDGVRKKGRGGVLGLGSVQATQSGASRTSPVLRGNWVVETLLGEKLPRPPANVPRLPETEGESGLTMRQQVERHAKDQACAVCHVRIDPFGFALEKYDPIGRLRQKDLGGLEVDTRVKLRDGTAFVGIDGLRAYLLTKKKDVIVRLFCRRLLGYALGRSVTLSDTALLDEMTAALEKNSGRVSAAVSVLVTSKPFTMIRGKAYSH